jgi:hypothetical protein
MVGAPPFSEPRFGFPVFEDRDGDPVVQAFHGTRASVAHEIVNTRAFESSRNPYDWLGHGVYFWQDSPQRAADWAKRHARGDAIGVVGARIRLGHCLDFVDTRYVRVYEEAASAWETAERAAGREPVRNTGKHMARECAIINFLCSHCDVPIDTIRAVYSEGAPVMPGSPHFRDSHIHLCVRNTAFILDIKIQQVIPQGQNP